MLALILDANLVVLLVVGRIDPTIVGQHRRVQQFDPSDYDLVEAIVDNARSLTSTPNVLTEASNLLGSGQQQVVVDAALGLERFAAEVRETYVPTHDLLGKAFTYQFGITDAGLIEAARSGMEIVTADFPLANWLSKHGLPVRNFNHLRYVG